MLSSPKVSTSTSHGGGYRRSASATSACPTPWRRADDRTASHVICVCGAARSSTPPRTWPPWCRTHSAVPRLMFRRNVDSKSGIGPNKDSTSRTISSQDATSARVPSLTALTKTECPAGRLWRGRGRAEQVFLGPGHEVNDLFAVRGGGVVLHADAVVEIRRHRGRTGIGLLARAQRGDHGGHVVVKGHFRPPEVLVVPHLDHPNPLG